MKVGIAYALPQRQVWLTLDVPENTTVREVIERSGLLERFPEIDLERQKVGVFNTVAKLDAVVQEGDRVEIYRPITADPKTVRRKDRGEGKDDSDEA